MITPGHSPSFFIIGGTRRGAKVREIIKLVLDASNRTNTHDFESPGRIGDPGLICVDINLIKPAVCLTSGYSLEKRIFSMTKAG